MESRIIQLEHDKPGPGEQVDPFVFGRPYSE